MGRVSMTWGAVAAAFVLAGCCRFHDQRAALRLRAYYVPIGMETLVGITSASIETQGSRCEIISVKDICAVRKVLDSATRPAPQKFTDLAVRVKLMEITDKGDKLLALVENDGLVRYAAGEDAVIAPKGMNVLKNVIEGRFAEDSEKHGAIRKVLHQVPNPSGAWTATLDQIEFTSGFTTPDYDRVVLTGARHSSPDGDVVFVQVRMPDAQNPAITWAADRRKR